MTFAATILTLYPEMFPGPLGHSIAGRALAAAKWVCETVQIRDFDSDGYYTRPDVFELTVDAQAKDGVEWR